MLVWVLAGCALFQPQLIPPDIALRAVTVERAALDEQVFRARLRITNRNDSRLRVADARLTLALDGVVVGEGRTLEGFAVPGRAEEDVDVRIVTNLVGHAPRLLDAFLAKDGALVYRVTGYVDVGVAGFGRLNIDESGAVGLPYPRDSSLPL